MLLKRLRLKLCGRRRRHTLKAFFYNVAGEYAWIMAVAFSAYFFLVGGLCAGFFSSLHQDAVEESCGAVAFNGSKMI